MACAQVLRPAGGEARIPSLYLYPPSLTQQPRVLGLRWSAALSWTMSAGPGQTMLTDEKAQITMMRADIVPAAVCWVPSRC